MATQATTQWSRLLATYAEKTPRSRALFERARDLFPNGVTHIGRDVEPYPIYADRGEGSRKWDVDGNEYVDYFGGHGSLILGHCHPTVTEAVQRQVARAAHYGASHEAEVRWAELIREMIPSAERVRFTNSGTEATHLALRIARAFTGKNKIVRFAGHFHGWHDNVSFPAGGAPGIIPGMVDETILVPAHDIAKATEVLTTRNDIAALILEPTGASFGHVPAPPELLGALRELTARTNVVLIFDEVISGFRCSPGGAQAFYGVRPDMTTLAKILAGGYPGAAVAGRADLLAMLTYTRGKGGIVPPPVPHQGTFNASPVSAVAGVATLEIVRDTDAIQRANQTAAAIRDGMNAAIRRKGAGWCVYGLFSDFHVYANLGGPPASVDDVYSGRVSAQKLKGAMPAELAHKVRIGMLANGVDIIGWPGGMTSAAHTGADVDRTVGAFESVLEALAEDGDLN